MKKTYVSPLTTEVSVSTEGMLAASVNINDSSNTVNSQDNGVQLSNDRRGEWGNLWNK